MTTASARLAAPLREPGQHPAPRPLRICLVAAARHPVAEPFAGGLESQTHHLARLLAERGHEVTLVAPAGAAGLPGVRVVDSAAWEPSAAAGTDVHAPSGAWMREHHAYLGTMLDLARTAGRSLDLVHDHSLHHLPVAMAATVGVPVVTTLHTPPLPWLESAVALTPTPPVFTAVSATCARAWAHCLDAAVVRNGVDTALWRPGPGGDAAVWVGRLTAEKAPHEAVAAARAAGLRIRLAGPVSDPAYVERAVRPLLGPGVTYEGHLGQRDLAELVGRSAVALVTPSWEEPYGLVAAEAMACGTPVAAYARGALREVVPPGAGVLSPAGDPVALGAAALTATTLDRRRVRAAAVEHCSIERMVEEYEAVYARQTAREPAA